MTKLQLSILITVAFLISSNAKTTTSPAPATAPAPAPAQSHVNLTELLTVAGPFHTFLDYLLSTGIIETFQNQTEEGITIFVPKDEAFKSQTNPPLSNLTTSQLKQLLLFHALPHYYALSEFKTLSQTGPVNTFAGEKYQLNFTDDMGTVRIDSLWTKTKISSSVYSTDPVAVYQVNRVILPEAIFGTDVPPMPAPALAPVVGLPSDSPLADSPGVEASLPKSSEENSVQTTVITPMVMVVSGLVALFL